MVGPARKSASRAPLHSNAVSRGRAHCHDSPGDPSLFRKPTIRLFGVCKVAIRAIKGNTDSVDQHRIGLFLAEAAQKERVNSASYDSVGNGVPASPRYPGTSVGAVNSIRIDGPTRIRRPYRAALFHRQDGPAFPPRATLALCLVS
jgi:hypothetical protein